MSSAMLTTMDNPFDPFTQFDEWYAFDVQAGYNSCALLDRVSLASDELSDDDQDLANTSAIDAIIRENIYPDYTKVVRKDVISESI